MFRRGGFNVEVQSRIAEEAERYASRDSRRQGIGLGLSSTHSKLNELKARVRSQERDASSHEKGGGHWIRDDMKNAKFAFLADERRLTEEQQIEEDYHQQRAMFEKNRVMKGLAVERKGKLDTTFDIAEQDKKRLKQSSDGSHYDAIFAPVGSSAWFHTKTNAIENGDEVEVKHAKESPKTRDLESADLVDVPLYKKLKKGDLIMAKYAPDGRWYKARILSAIQTGYINCKYDIKFENYGNIETVSWRDAEEIAHVHKVEETDEEVGGRDGESSSIAGSAGGISPSNEKDIFGRDIRKTDVNDAEGSSSCLESLEKSVLQKKNMSKDVEILSTDMKRELRRL